MPHKADKDFPSRTGKQQITARIDYDLYQRFEKKLESEGRLSQWVLTQLIKAWLGEDNALGCKCGEHEPGEPKSGSPSEGHVFKFPAKGEGKEQRGRDTDRGPDPLPEEGRKGKRASS